MAQNDDEFLGVFGVDHNTVKAAVHAGPVQSSSFALDGVEFKKVDGKRVGLVGGVGVVGLDQEKVFGVNGCKLKIVVGELWTVAGNAETAEMEKLEVVYSGEVNTIISKTYSFCP